jgi:sugar lactone lactonase YvrE
LSPSRIVAAARPRYTVAMLTHSQARSSIRLTFMVALGVAAGAGLPALAGCGGGEATTSSGGSSAATTSTTSTTATTSASTGGEGGAGGAGSTTTTGSTGGAGGGAGGGGGTAPTTFLDTYPLTAQYPEGGTYDPGAHAFFVGSLGDGSVHQIDATTGAEQVLFTESAPGKWWTLGMDVDVVRRRLWVCAMDDRSPDPRAGFIWIFDLKTGKRIANHDLSKAAADATCTDVALTKDGTGYVGDREAGNLYKVDVATGATLFAQSPDLAASFVGQNSLVVLPDESALLSLLYLPSGLVRIDLNDASVKPVDITGKFSDLTPLHGADGMAYANGSVYVAFTQKLIRVKPTLSDWSAATSTNVDIPNGMTDIVSTPNGLYLLNGQSLRFALGQSPDPFQLVRFTGSL